MENTISLDFEALKRNIIDVIQEEQIKLGFRKETIRLYYPMESLNNLLGAKLSLQKLQKALEQFAQYVKEHFGEIEFSNRENRFCIVIPEQGVIYIHETVEEKHFLKEFIGKISGHDNNLDDILQVFKRYSDRVVCEKTTHGEFDYLIYFEDGIPDSYRYCIKFEDCHSIYHRFTISDYENFEF